MIYFTFIGSHDKIEQGKPFGAALTIFLQYKDSLNHVYIFTSSEKTSASIDFDEIALDTKRIMLREKRELSVDIIPLALQNPTDYEIVYPVMLNEIQNILENKEIQNTEKIINITSGTPTMSACWVLLHKSGLIPNSKIIQSFETKYARVYGSSTREVDLNIDDFPHIEAPSAIKRQLTIISREKERLEDRLKSSDLDNKIPELTGKSEAIREIKEQILYDIDETCNVLISGERGTGKQMAANALWRLYHRKNDNRLTTFDCGAISSNLIVSELFGYKKGSFTGAEKDYEGILKSSDGRMLFLDEIGNLPMEGQQALLRYMQTGEIRAVGGTDIVFSETQIIAATNKNINDENIFAQDLKDRFDEIIYLPALRERKEDIPLLIEMFIERSTDKAVVISDDLMTALMEYDWPGNIRELEKWVRKLLRRFRDGGNISIADLPGRMINGLLKEDDENDLNLPDLPLPVSLDEYIEKIRQKARIISHGNMAEVDRLLKQNIGTEKQRRWREKKR